jgi:hypothetical protein
VPQFSHTHFEEETTLLSSLITKLRQEVARADEEGWMYGEIGGVEEMDGEEGYAAGAGGVNGHGHGHPGGEGGGRGMEVEEGGQ